MYSTQSNNVIFKSVRLKSYLIGDLFYVILQMESTNGDQIQCEVCGVALSCAYSLKRHMQLHSDSTYECDFPECGKTFKCKKNLCSVTPVPTPMVQKSVVSVGRSSQRRIGLTSMKMRFTEARHRSIHVQCVRSHVSRDTHFNNI